MTTNDPKDIEKILVSLSPKSVPPGLKGRVLESALKKRQGLLMTPGTWAAAAACTALMAIAVLGDTAVTKVQNNDLRAFLNGTSVSRLTGEEPGPLSEEVYEEIGNVEKAGLERIILTRPGTRSAFLRDIFEARKRLKGWLDHEDESTESPD